MSDDANVSELIEGLRSAHRGLEEEKMRDWNRAVPLGDLVGDRNERARFLGFGDKTTIYDSSVVIGDVTAGENCWFGPNTYLDGLGGLSMGDFVTIGAGTMIASHSSVLRDMSRHKLPLSYKATKIGDQVFVGPMCLIEMGTVIGDCCYIHAHSVVRGEIAANSIVHGNPGRVIGTVSYSPNGSPDFRFNRDGMKMIAPITNGRARPPVA